ncbi:hypothetical protein RND81_07G171600 [Saponaria officinalis]|uniref:Uncharacterized protein n=1 Tax=Saponaria officinalis TaxID=3572 RepID=A0AAW1JPF8_SAPOF
MAATSSKVVLILLLVIVASNLLMTEAIRGGRQHCKSDKDCENDGICRGVPKCTDKGLCDCILDNKRRAPPPTPPYVPMPPICHDDTDCGDGCKCTLHLCIC